MSVVIVYNCVSVGIRSIMGRCGTEMSRCNCGAKTSVEYVVLVD